MIYSDRVQKLVSAGFSLDEIRRSASDKYRKMLGAGFDQKEARTWLKDTYGLTAGTTIEDLDDAHYLSSLMFQDLSPKTETTSSVTGAISAGFQNSIVGLVSRGQAPNMTLSPDADLVSKTAYSLSQGLGDLPTLIAGGLFGGAAGAVAGPVGAGAGAGAGAGFVTEYMRSALVQSYASGKSTTPAEFTQQIVNNFLAGGKGAAIGAVAGGVGSAAPVALAGATLPIPKALEGVTKGAMSLGAEAAAIATTMGAVEGHLPKAEDFILAGAAMASFKGMNLYVGKYVDEFAKNGLTPKDVLQLSVIDPLVRERAASVNQRITETFDTKSYRGYPRLSEKDLLARTTDLPEKLTPEAIEAIRLKSPIEPAEYTNVWISENKRTATKQAKDALGESAPDARLLLDEVTVDKNQPLIRFKGQSDSTMVKAFREYLATDEGKAEMVARDPEAFTRNPDWFKQFETKLDERIVPTAKAMFNEPSAEFVSFLRNNVWQPEMANKLSGGSITVKNPAKIMWAGIRVTDMEGSRFMMFSSEPIKVSSKRPTGVAPYDTALSAVYDKVSIGDKSERSIGEVWNSLQSNLVDSLKSLDEYSETGKHSEGYVEARLAAGSSGQAMSMFDIGMLKYDPKGGTAGDLIVGKSLKEILKPVAELPGGTKEFSAYLAAKSVKELNERGAKVHLDPDHAAAILKGPNASVFEPVAKEIMGFYDGLLKYQKDGGILSQSAYDRIKRSNADGLPLEKMIEAFEPELKAEVDRTTMGAFASKLMAKSTDGKVIIDPIESLVKATFLTTRLVAQNKARAQVARDYGIPIKGGNVDSGSGQVVISYMNRGKVYRAAVRRDIAAATRELDASGIHMYNAAMRGVAKATGIFRVGTTFDPQFGIKNLLIDQLTAYIQRPEGSNYKPFISMAKGFSEIIKSKMGKVTSFDDWLVNGGGNVAITTMARDFNQEIMRELTKTPVRNVLRNPIKHYKELLYFVNPLSAVKGVYKGLEALAEYSDTATRVGSYMEAVKAGYSPKDAAFLSRDSTVDFARSGATIKSVNMIYAFMNAKFQGLSRMGETIARDPVRVASDVIKGVVIPSALLAMVQNDIIYNNQSPNSPLYDQARALQARPAWERAAFWTIPIPGVANVRVPKPREWAIAAASPIESYISSLYSEGKVDLLTQMHEDGLLGGMRDMVLPDITPTILSPVLEVRSNYSAFTGNNLIPTFMENEMPVTQYRPGTSITAQLISKSLFNIAPEYSQQQMGRFASPIGIDHLIRGWTGALGTNLVSMLDSAIEASGKYTGPVKPARTMAEMPFFKVFVAKYPGPGSNDIAAFNEESKILEQRYNSVMRLAKNGDHQSIAMADKLMNSGPMAELTGIHSAMGAMNKVINQIYVMNDDPESKRQQIETIYMQMEDLAKMGRVYIKDIEEANK